MAITSEPEQTRDGEGDSQGGLAQQGQATQPPLRERLEPPDPSHPDAHVPPIPREDLVRGDPFIPPEALPPEIAAEEIKHKTWKDPSGFWGWLVTVQNGPIVERFMGTIFIFFCLAGLQAVLMRTQLIRPENDFLSPRLYNQLFTMHGSTMIFLVAVPMMEAFGELLFPPMLGTRELPFPRMTALLFWVYLLGGIIFYSSFLTGQAPDAGWFAYVPLSGPIYSPGLGIDFWNLGLDVAQIAAMGDAFEFLVSIIRFRAPGMSLNRMPIYVWSVLAMSLMMMFGFTPLIMATFLLEFDRHFGTRFFDPAYGGDPVLWQHLFWIFGHPDVYIMFIPATGMVSMIVATFTRRSVVGYTMIVVAIVATAFLSFGLWVHHMFAVGISALALTFFTAASMTVSIPSGIQVTAWIATIWRGRPVLKTPMLFVIGFIVVFVIGGLTGPMLASVPFDIQVHDTFFVVAHFHYVMIGGVIFPMFAGLYYWLPKMKGRMLSERWGKWVFWLIFIGFNTTFFPMHFSGIWGMPRRVYTYLPGLGWDVPNFISTIGAYIMGLGVLLFIIDAFRTVVLVSFAPPSGDNPWNAGTLDWATETPPPHEGYLHIPIVHSREPLWEQASLREGDPRVVAIVEGLARYPTNWRATLVTSLVDAVPIGVLRMAEPSIWPLTVALLITIIFAAELISMHVPAVICAILMVVAINCWLWPPKVEREMMLAGHPSRTTLFGLPVYLSGPSAPGWWAMLITITICSVAAACLYFTYFYLRASATSWPLGNLDKPALLMPLVALLLLGASAAPARWAETGILHGKQRPVLIGLGATWLLTAAYFGLCIANLASAGFTHQTNAYGSAFFGIMTLQIIFTFAALVLCGNVQAQAWLGYFNRWRHLAVQNTAFWQYFLIANGAVTFAILYLAPRVF